MTTACQYPNALFTYGYKELSSAESDQAATALSLIYAAIGVVLGILTGTALASATWLLNTPVASPEMVQVSSSTPGLNIHPIANAVQTPALVNQAVIPGNQQLSSPLKSTTGTTASAHQHHAVRRLSAALKFTARHKAIPMHQPNVTPHAPAPAPSPSASYELRLNPEAAPSAFIIEGDVSVADYDASEGIITTDVGRNFVLDRTAAESNGTIWQEYRANVHYRCDRSGNCTLSRAGLVVPNARLST
jgi:hypothetical protein